MDEPKATIVVMPGVERRDLTGEPTPSETAFQAATEAGVTDAIIIGRARDGSLYVASCDPNIDAVVGKLFYAAQWLISGEFRRGE